MELLLEERNQMRYLFVELALKNYSQKTINNLSRKIYFSKKGNLVFEEKE